MFTEQDLKNLKKIQHEYYERKQSQQNSSSGFEQKTEEELYISKYLINGSFKILHIDITGFQQIRVSLGLSDSYIIYNIKIITEDFSYDITKRYSQFLNLYQKIKVFQILRNNSKNIEETPKPNINNSLKNQYNFPTKRISSSLLQFFHASNKQKLAQERKSELCSFLNQIRSQFYKNQNLFLDDYIELLKFINMKTQHEKFWKRKQGRILQISNLPNQMKTKQKQNEQINVQHLTQILQHQMNKINLAVTVKQSVYKSSPNLNHLGEQIKLQSDIMVTDQIIKNVDAVRDIVLQLKKKINYDHIRCILKGKDIKNQSNSLSKIKNGLIQYSLKYSTNQLVSIHIIRTILFVFTNSQCNYSSDAFIKVLSELDFGSFVLNQEKEQLAFNNRQFRQMYFKLLKMYIDARQQYGSDKKTNLADKFPLEKLMGLSLVKLYQTWCQNNKKNKQFKMKDEQKDWKMIIQNFPRRYSPKKTHQSFDMIKARNSILQQHFANQNHIKRHSKIICQASQDSQIIKYGQVLKFENQQIIMSLITQQHEEQHCYFLSSKIKNKTYEKCIQIIKREQSWNPLLIHTQTDIYSNTRKDCLQIPGKQEKMFRFVQRQEIQLNIHDELDEKQEKQPELGLCQNYVALQNQQELNQHHHSIKNPKTSTQTMPSASGSCAHEHQPEPSYNEPQDGLANSKLSQKFVLIKSPPEDSACNSYYQRIQVQRLQKLQKSQEPCGIQIQIILTQSSTKKYFASQISKSTLYIWEGFKKAFGVSNEINQIY